MCGYCPGVAELEGDGDEDDPLEGEPLTRWQRAAAAAAGVALSGAGAASVFLSGNQAGSVALLAVGGAFLLVAVNGMPILGARLKDYELTMARRRRRLLGEIEQEALEEQRAQLRVLRTLDPKALYDQAVVDAQGRVFAQELANALGGLLPQGDVVDVDAFEHPRTLLITSETGRIGVVVSFVGMLKAVWSLRRDVQWLAQHGDCQGILVVNGRRRNELLPLYTDAMDRGTALPRAMAQWKWSDDEQDRQLGDAVAEVKRQIQARSA